MLFNPLYSGNLYMKKVNNRYRNNNNSNNTIYSLNYKFDSNSVAGKISGTALDLIKRYNDLAKDAHSNNDYVTAEIFRQYAEHYRKIVTEINERKNAREQQEANDNANASVENQPAPEANAEPVAAQQPETEAPKNAEEKAPKAEPVKKAFHVIEINQAKADEAQPATAAEPAKPRRVYRRKPAAAAAAEA